VSEESQEWDSVDEESDSFPSTFTLNFLNFLTSTLSNANISSFSSSFLSSSANLPSISEDVVNLLVPNVAAGVFLAESTDVPEKIKMAFCTNNVKTVIAVPAIISKDTVIKRGI